MSAAVLTRSIHHFHELPLLHGVCVLLVQVFHELKLVVVIILLLVVLVLVIAFTLAFLHDLARSREFHRLTTAVVLDSCRRI